MTDIAIPEEAEEAAARAIIIANGGDPDALMRLTIHKTTIKAWQGVAPLARAALTAGLAAWPGAFQTTTQINRDATEVLILPLPKQSGNV